MLVVLYIEPWLLSDHFSELALPIVFSATGTEHGCTEHEHANFELEKNGMFEITSRFHRFPWGSHNHGGGGGNAYVRKIPNKSFSDRVSRP